MIERVLNSGNALIAAKHFAAPDIKEKIDELSNDWDDLMKQSANRRNRLEASLAKHKVTSQCKAYWIFFTVIFELNVSSWSLSGVRSALSS